MKENTQIGVCLLCLLLLFMVQKCEIVVPKTHFLSILVELENHSSLDQGRKLMKMIMMMMTKKRRNNITTQQKCVTSEPCGIPDTS